MFKKRIRISVILFSVLLMVVLGSIFVNHEIDIYQSKEEQANKITQVAREEWQIYTGLSDICRLRKDSPILIEKFIDKFLGNVNIRKSNDIYLLGQTHELFQLSSFDVAIMPDFQNSIGIGEFIQANIEDARNFYREQLILISAIYPGFSLWHYFGELLLVFGISIIPLLLALLSSLFAVSFPVAAPITVLVLLFFVAIQGYADDTAIAKLMTSATGDENSLTLGMLYLGEKSGGLIIVPRKGIWGAYGPVWKFPKGMAFFPIGIICGKGENGFRVEHLSIWSISSVNIGKFNHLLMGSYNHPLVKDRSPFASFKQTLYYTVSKVKLGIRIDYSFQKIKEWKTKISIGPTLQLVKDKFIFHIHASITRPYTIKTEWQLFF